MDVERVRKQGVDDINKAIEYDNMNSNTEAFTHYIRGIGNLLLSAKYTKNNSLKNTIMVKVVGYIDRAETIKQHLDKKQKQTSPVTSPTPSPARNEPAVPVTDESDVKLKSVIMGTRVARGDTGVTWDDVVGLAATKDALVEAVILPKKFPSMFSGNRQPWSAILMYGPPGTGKSFLAKAVATEAGSTFFSVSASDIMSKWQGESEKTIKVLFQVAREEAPSVVFIDEIDSLAGARVDGEQESTRRIKTQLMTEMQGVGSTNSAVLVLAATNTPWSLDSAFRRRFQKRVYVGLPSRETRLIMFKKGLKDTVVDDIDFNALADATEGYSGSDISNVIRESLMVPIRKCRFAKQFIAIGSRFMPVSVYPNCPLCPVDLSNDPARGKKCKKCGAFCKLMEDLDDETLEIPPVTTDDVLGAIDRMHKSVAPEELVKYDEWTTEYGQDGA